MLKLEHLRIILALMIIALIGVISLQYYWIRHSLDLAKNQFSKNTLTALNEVSKELTSNETNIISDFFIQNVKPYSGACLKDEPVELPKEKKFKKTTLRYLPPFDNIESKDISKQCNCKKCRQKLYYQYMETYLEKKNTSPPPIEQRIDTTYLTKLLKLTLKSKGITSPFTYGVYSKATGRFEIVATLNNNINGSINNFLKQSEFKTEILNQGIRSTGLLSLYFPTLNSSIWKSIWLVIVASVFFVAIILCSFLYAVKTILSQKKVAEIKNDFINNITHEFKTPIATISLATDSINNDQIIQNPGKIKKFTNIIKQENKRMLSQVEMVLQTAMMERGEVSLNLSQVDLHEIIHQASHNIELKLKAKEGDLILDLDANDAVITADEVHIANIINNLLDNANKYSPLKPVLQITTKNVKEGVLLSIRDNGLGMSKEQIKQIFEKFYRVSTGDKHDVKGHGLGLTYVNAMVKAHEAQIKVQSEPGEGSKFSILFKKNINN